MCLQAGVVEHDRLDLGPFCRKTRHNSGKHTQIAPSLPTVIQDLLRAVFTGRVIPPQPIVIDEDYAAENAPVINARFARLSGNRSPGSISDLPHLGEEGLQTSHQGVGQPERLLIDQSLCGA
jgi:hypothetical protein